MRTILFSFFILISATIIANANEGASLHQSECIDCHSRMTGGDGTVIYKRDDRLAKTLDDLTARVIHCAQGSNTGWNTSQIEAVTQYLNQQFYQY